MNNRLQLLIFFASFWLLAGCTAQAAPVSLSVNEVTPPSEADGQRAMATATAEPSLTPFVATPTAGALETIPQPSQSPPMQITSVPTSAITRPTTAGPTATVTAAPSPTTEPDRFCPENNPLKPEYDRYYLSGNKWPSPDLEIAGPHFWLAKPLPGAGRTLINQRFPYGWDENGRLLLHNGVDIAEDLGMEVLAAADGTVVVAQSDAEAWYGWRCDWYGHLVVIELDQTWQDQPIFVLYGHVLNLKVSPGDRVNRGQPVAEIGFGGAATHPHLHLEVRVGENEFDSTRNPMLWIDPGPSRGVIAGRLIDPQGRPWQGVPLALVNTEQTTERASTWSYLGDPQQLMNPDEGWAENFVFSDVKPGEYDIYTQIQGYDYRQPVTVKAGEVSVVEIVTEPLQEETIELTVTTEANENVIGDE